MEDKPNIFVRASIIRETDKAWFISIKRKKCKKAVWIPKSRAKISGERINDYTGFTTYCFELEHWLWDKILDQQKKYVPPAKPKPIVFSEYPFCPEYNELDDNMSKDILLDDLRDKGTNKD